MKNRVYLTIKDWFRIHKNSIFYKLLFTVVLYSILLTNNLVNRQDGIWNGATYCAGDWELSIGRWALRYIDFSRFAISINPWTSILTLLFFVIGTELAIDVFRIKVDSKWNYLGSFMFLGNMIVCDVLTYTYTSNAYGIAFLLSMLSVKIINAGSDYWINDKKKSLIYLSLSAVTLGIMMGIYQSYLGCVCVVIVICIINQLITEEKYVDILRYTIISLATGLAGFVIYEVCLKIELIHWNVQLSDYNGANAVSVGNILADLKVTLPKAYDLAFYQEVVGTNFKWNFFRGKAILLLLAICLVVFMSVIARRIWKSAKLNLAVICALICLVPLAANICVVLAPQGMFWEQQTAPIAVIIPCLIWVMSRQLNSESLLENVIPVFLTLVLLWGSLYQVVIDQEAMREGLNSATTIATEAVGMMINSDEYDSSLPIAIIGTPYDNELFLDTGISEKASLYARVGGYSWFGGYTDLYNWKGIIENRMGINLKCCADEEYLNLIENEDVQNMSEFPNKQCIQCIGDVLVIKISDVRMRGKK